MVTVTVLRAKNCSAGWAAPSPTTSSNASMANMMRNVGTPVRNQCRDVSGDARAPSSGTAEGAKRQKRPSAGIAEPQSSHARMPCDRLPTARGRRYYLIQQVGVRRYSPTRQAWAAEQKFSREKLHGEKITAV